MQVQTFACERKVLFLGVPDDVPGLAVVPGIAIDMHSVQPRFVNNLTEYTYHNK